VAYCYECEGFAAEGEAGEADAVVSSEENADCYQGVKGDDEPETLLVWTG